MGRGKNKGSNFEREICKKLSLWWTDGQNDDIFWRTASSGGRATQRSKKKQKTFGQYGDVQATDPIGQPLIDLCNIELKRGYSSETFANLIETHQNPKVKSCLYERFIKQAIMDCRIRDDGSEWILMVKRDGREAILLTSFSFYNSIHLSTNKPIPKFPIIKMQVKIEHHWKKIFGMQLKDFLSNITPKMILHIWRRKYGKTK